MECQFSEGEKTIPHWAQDYRKLRGLRRTRNTLAHNVSEYQVCTEQDVENVIDFVDRIMQQQDPLAMLNLYNSKDEESETMDESEVSVPDSFYYDSGCCTAGHNVCDGNSCKHINFPHSVNCIEDIHLKEFILPNFYK